MAVRAVEELKVPTFVKLVHSVRMYWATEQGQTHKTNSKRNTDTMTENEPKIEDWEHKLIVNKYIRGYVQGRHTSLGREQMYMLLSCSPALPS